MIKYRDKNGQYWDGSPITVGNMMVVNPQRESLLEAGYEEVEVQEPVLSKAEQLNIAKLHKQIAIEDYNESENVNSFTLDGESLWLDAATRQQLRTSINAYIALGRNSVTKWFEGKHYTYTCERWIQMLDTLEVYASEALNVTEAHKALVSAMTDIEEVNAFDITAGYPEKVVFES